MLLLALLAIIGIVVIYQTQKDNQRRTRNDLLNQINLLKQYGLDFLKGYESVAKTKSEKSLLARMEADYRRWQGLPDTDPERGGQPENRHAAAPAAVSVPAAQHQPPVNPGFYQPQPKTQNVQLDNASLLLYFGAFLFVAASGLFVAFGTASGSIKTFIVLLVTLAMYTGGIWLYRNRPRLRQAGQAFAGIGVVLAPLVGVALYSYAFDRQQGYLVWLLTSVFCLTMYAHALTVFRTTLMGYVLVFTFVSLFESAVGVLDVPVYYYGWGLALAALMLQFANRQRRWGPELNEPTQQGAQLFLPLALLVSLYNLPDAGAVQLGISLLLATLFYGLEFLRTTGEARLTNAVISQSSSLAATGLLAYGIWESGNAASIAVMVWIAIQLVALLIRSRSSSRVWQNFGSVLLVASVADAVLSLGHPSISLTMTVATVIIGVIVWYKQWRVDGYAVGMLALLAAPYLYGQLVRDNFTAMQQTEAGFVALLAVLIVYIVGWQRSQRIGQWKQSALTVILLGVAGVMFASLFGGPYVCLAAALAAAFGLVLLAEHDRWPIWAEAAGVTLLVPILRAFGDDHPFLLCVEISLIMLVALTIRYRRESLRWLSTTVWLVVPYALAHGGIGGRWPAEAYAWGYVAAMLVLVVSRAVARGIVMLSNKVVVSSLARKASAAYVFGYSAAAAIAIAVSLSANNSQLHTSLILAALVGVVWILSRFVERRSDLLAFLPLLLQGLLLSAVRPALVGSTIQVYLILSSVLAVIIYAEAAERRGKSAALIPVAEVAMLSSFIAPFAIVAAPLNWAMPTGLLVAGGLLLHYLWDKSQAAREIAVSVMAAAVAWFAWWLGLREFQVYAHIVVAVLAGFAYWRHRMGRRKVSDQYIIWTLAAATVPLALQALSSTSGGLYGWWLLLEQVAIMLVGMTIGRRFVTLWGLYVAVAAVLYQLRGLGYAALAVLAVFLIGLAVYQLQKDGK